MFGNEYHRHVLNVGGFVCAHDVLEHGENRVGVNWLAVHPSSQSMYFSDGDGGCGDGGSCGGDDAFVRGRFDAPDIDMLGDALSAHGESGVGDDGTRGDFGSVIVDFW